MYSRNLFKLILNNNNLTIILNGMFRGLISLKLLDLSRNKIQQIKSTAFRDLKQLEEIYLNLNYLIAIHKYLFNLNTNLNKSDLSHNKLRYIENNTFGNLNKLATVNLHGNKLAYIQKGMLTGLSHGKFSHYEASRSTVFNLLQLLIFLVKLCLSVTFLNTGENRIRIIEAKSFENMTNLNRLNLDKNNISNIHRSMFTGLCALLTLNLENNKIKAIEDGSFLNLNLYLDNITMNFISWKYFLQKALTLNQSAPTPFLNLHYHGNLTCSSTLCWIIHGNDTSVSKATVRRIYNQCDWKDICPSKGINFNSIRISVVCCVIDYYSCFIFRSMWLTRNTMLHYCTTSGFNEANNSIEDNFCPFQYFCHCSCAQFDQNVGEADCSRENLAPLPGVITKANCSLCDCSCTLFRRENCTEECAGNGRIPVVGFKDKEGSPAYCMHVFVASLCHSSFVEIQFHQTNY